MISKYAPDLIADSKDSSDSPPPSWEPYQKHKVTPYTRMKSSRDSWSASKMDRVETGKDGKEQETKKEKSKEKKEKEENRSKEAISDESRGVVTGLPPSGRKASARSKQAAFSSASGDKMFSIDLEEP